MGKGIARRGASKLKPMVGKAGPTPRKQKAEFEGCNECERIEGPPPKGIARWEDDGGVPEGLEGPVPDSLRGRSVKSVLRSYAWATSSPQKLLRRLDGDPPGFDDDDKDRVLHHAHRICHKVGLSLGAVEALCFLAQQCALAKVLRDGNDYFGTATFEKDLRDNHHKKILGAADKLAALLRKVLVPGEVFERSRKVLGEPELSDADHQALRRWDFSASYFDYSAAPPAVTAGLLMSSLENLSRRIRERPPSQYELTLRAQDRCLVDFDNRTKNYLSKPRLRLKLQLAILKLTDAFQPGTVDPERKLQKAIADAHARTKTGSRPG